MRRSSFVALFLLLVLVAPRAHAEAWAWSDSVCVGGGSWTGPCWNNQGFPNDPEDSVFLALSDPGNVVIPTSSVLAITLNALTVTPSVGLVVEDNMVLALSPSPNGADPSLLLDSVLTISSPDIGASALRAMDPLEPEGTSELEITGSGEIRLGDNGGVVSAPRARIHMGGGIEITSSAATDKPARILAALTNEGGEIRVLGGPLVIDGDVQNTAGGFVEVFDQFSTGFSEIRLQGLLRGGRVYPGDGVVKLYGGELANITVEPGPVEITANGTFGGEVALSNGTAVTVPPARTLDLAGGPLTGAPRLTNDGVVRVGSPSGGAGTLRIDGSLVEIDGNGSIVIDHPGSALATTGGGVLRNGPDHTIQGHGYVQCTVQNEGWIFVEGGSMVLFSGVQGMGGHVVVLGDATVPARLDVRAAFSTHDLRITAHGRLDVGGGRSVVVQGDWIVETQDESAILWNPGTSLNLSGGEFQGFEVTSQDLGAVNAGFSGNFAMRRLIIGQSGTHVFLRDLADNGNRAGADEAVYTNELQVQPGATLNLNGYCLYTLVGGVPYRVQAGDGPEFGGGTIIDDPSVPTAIDDTPARSSLSSLRIAPNPFNPRTTVRFRLERPGDVHVTVHDARGRRVRELAHEVRPRGEHEIVWDGRDDAGQRLASGVYSVRLVTADERSVQRVTLLK